MSRVLAEQALFLLQIVPHGGKAVDFSSAAEQSGLELRDLRPARYRISLLVNPC